MLILGIDTSCDETSVSLLEDDKFLVQVISSQVKQQKEWGGVVPMLAKRNHIERMELVLAQAIQWGMPKGKIAKKTKKALSQVILESKLELRKSKNTKNIQIDANAGGSYRPSEAEIKAKLQLKRLVELSNPGIDLIAVTIGPGLSVALEVGVEAARQLAAAWNVQVMPINHMEGHFWSGLIKNSEGKLGSELDPLAAESFPVMGFLVSGGHTELVMSREFGSYEVIGETLDDAAGEAFDKFAVMVGLGYPGGAAVERLANGVKKAGKALQNRALVDYPLPIMMKTTGDLNFSFSGLKTAALYTLERNKAKLEQGSAAENTLELTKLCYSFQNAVVESLALKLRAALKLYQPKALLAGGGVIANKAVRLMLRNVAREYGAELILPTGKFLTDNGSMIGLSGYLRYKFSPENIVTAADLKSNPKLLDRNPGLRLS